MQDGEHIPCIKTWVLAPARIVKRIETKHVKHMEREIDWFRKQVHCERAHKLHTVAKTIVFTYGYWLPCVGGNMTKRLGT